MNRQGNHWDNDAEHPGSMFHEIMVLPTLAPHLARPEYLLPHGEGPVIYPQPRSQQLANGIVSVNEHLAAAPQPANVDEGTARQGSPAFSVSSNDTVTPNDSTSAQTVPFFVNVNLERVQQTFTNRGPGKPKVVADSKPGPKLPILDFTRKEMVQNILDVHGLRDRYLPGPTFGPPFRLSCKGLSGGVKAAPTIRDDDSWANVVSQLAALKGKHDTVQITLALKDLEPYQNHKRALSPDPLEEMMSGSYVPSASQYSATQLIVGKKVNAIKAAWPCVKHGVCFIDADGLHIKMNRFRLNAWGSCLVTGEREPKDPPPPELINEWRGNNRRLEMPLPKPRGVQGPHAMPTNENSGLDFSALLTQFAGPVVKSLATIAMTHLSPSSPVPGPSSERLSSPPPAIEDELVSCLHAFGASRKISDVIRDTAIANLDEAAFTPDIMGEVDVGRLKELTGLAEGHTIALRKFARQWCGKIEAKRARH